MAGPDHSRTENCEVEDVCLLNNCECHHSGGIEYEEIIMIQVQTENPQISEILKAKYPNGIGDLFLAQQKEALHKSGLLEKIADQMDHYTRFHRMHPEDLAQEHRWTGDDVGKTFVGFEVPNSKGTGIVFEVSVAAVYGPSAISVEVSTAFDLTYDSGGDHSAWCFGPFPAGATLKSTGKTQ